MHGIFPLEVNECVWDKFGLKYIPEQIVGIAKIHGDKCVSHERIYQFIWKEKRQNETL